MKHQPFIYNLTAPGCSLGNVTEACEKAVAENYSGVCVLPLLVPACKEKLVATGLEISAAIGFPTGHSVIEAKLAETVLAMVDGADEICLHINILALKNLDWQYLAKELNTIQPVVQAKQKKLVIVLDISYLTNEELIQCCDLYGAAAVNAFQLGTGFNGAVANLETIKTVRTHLADAVAIRAAIPCPGLHNSKEFLDAGANGFIPALPMLHVKQLHTEPSGMIFEQS